MPKLGLLLLIAMIGCRGGMGNPTLAELSSELVSDNGVSLNGVSLNGVSLNGVSLNGVSLNGVSLNGVSLNGVSLNGVSLNGTELTGSNPSGLYLTGSSFVGSRLSGNLSSGASLTLRVDGLWWDGATAWYNLSYQTQSGWQPLCGVDGYGAAISAVFLKGTWNPGQGVVGGGSWTDTPNTFTPGCRNAALGKCVALGYRPWWGGGWIDHHQACVRMIRADYCGDGRSWTENGRAINLYDAFWAQTDTMGWQHEAEWNASGAICIAKRRVVKWGAPFCARERQTPAHDCTTYNPYNPFRAGTLIISEFESQLIE